MKTLICTLLMAGAALVAAQDRPNFLWLTAEDMSPSLGCNGDPDAITPRLDTLARQSVRYSRAFSTAPVCSPSRSCLITGHYATSLGTQRLRSSFPIPSGFAPFTAAMRAAGWHCTNNVKTDYNIQDERAFIRRAWDESSAQAHWRSRKPGQPFFAIFNFMTTHQSRTSAWPHEQFEKEIGSRLSPGERHEPSRMTLPPFYPDTAEARRAWARYHDCITLMDRQAGEILDQLDADGLSDDTIVFFYSDHGMGMPRGKRCLQDTGLHVPLLIRFPQKWSHLAPSAPGTSSDRLVSFVDFAPTMLSLCGLAIPDEYQGSAFLGSSASQPRAFVYGARDRVDEAFDVSRSARDGRWLYIRNFMPHLSWMQPEGFSDTSTFRQELKRLAAAHQLNADAMTFAAPTRTLEELYDTQSDPYQLHNLAKAAEHREPLQRMRDALRQWQIETRDLGFITEPQLWQRLSAGHTPWDIARDDSEYPLPHLLEVAGTVGDTGSAPQQQKWLRDDHDAARYWAAMGLLGQEKLDDSSVAALREALKDSSAVVRIEAAAALAHHGQTKDSLKVLTQELQSTSRETVLHAARTLQSLGTVPDEVRQAMQAALDAARAAEAAGDTIAMFIRFSLEAALQPQAP